MSVKTVILNIATGEVKVEPGDITFAKVRGKGRAGGYRIESKFVIPGETNVRGRFPAEISVSAGGAGYSF